MATKRKVKRQTRTSRPKLNKTQTIKDCMRDNPGLGPKDLAAKLTKEGCPVTAAYVSSIKTAMKVKDNINAMRGQTPHSSAGGLGDLIEDVAQVAQRCGGVSELRKVLDSAELIR